MKLQIISSVQLGRKFHKTAAFHIAWYDIYPFISYLFLPYTKFLPHVSQEIEGKNY